jgi:hypothetical protein
MSCGKSWWRFSGQAQTRFSVGNAWSLGIKYNDVYTFAAWASSTYGDWMLLSGCVGAGLPEWSCWNPGPTYHSQLTPSSWRCSQHQPKSGWETKFSIVLARRLARWLEHTGPSSWLGQDGAGTSRACSPSKFWSITSHTRQRIQGYNIIPGVAHRFIWRWSQSDPYSIASACNALFIGHTALFGAKELGKVCAPNSCRFFI